MKSDDLLGPKRLDMKQISRRTVAERDYWIDQLVMEVLRLRAALAEKGDEIERYRAAAGGSEHGQ